MSSMFGRPIVFLLLIVALASGAAAATGPAAGADARAIPFDRDTAMWLVALPLSCIDKPEDPPKGRGYLTKPRSR